MKIINLCVLTNSNYHNMGVFDDVVNSVAENLRLCGYLPIIEKNSIKKNCPNIIFGAGLHFSAPYSELALVLDPKNCAIFNLEQLMSNSNLVTNEYLEFISNYVVFDYSSHNVEYFRNKFGTSQIFEFPILPSVSFWDQNMVHSNKEYHFAFFGSINERRSKILNSLKEMGIRLNIIFNCYGSDLQYELNKCCAVINIHAYESSIFETVRMLRPLSNGMPIISENSLMPSSVNYECANIHFEQYNNLTTFCKNYIENQIYISEFNSFISADFNSKNIFNNKFMNLVTELISKIN